MIVEELYNLKLHETIQVSSECKIMRVPGGCIYIFQI